MSCSKRARLNRSAPDLLSGLIVAASEGGRGDPPGPRGAWGFAAEWLINGTLRWASEALNPTPVRIETSTEFVVIVASAPEGAGDQDEGGMKGKGKVESEEHEGEGPLSLFGLDRNSGRLLWTFRCQVKCKAQVSPDGFPHPHFSFNLCEAS